MSYFSATIQNAMKQKRLRWYWLAEFRFSAPMYLHNGRGVITANGHDWVGLGQLGRISGIQEALQRQARDFELSISAVDLNSSIVALAAGENEDNYVSKLVMVWMQFCDPNTWALLDNPYAVMCGRIDSLMFDRIENKDGSWTRTITCHAENIFATRRVASNGYYTPTDQEARFPGDRGLEFIAGLQDTEIAVPWT